MPIFKWFQDKQREKAEKAKIKRENDSSIAGESSHNAAITSASRLTKTLEELVRCHDALPHLKDFLKTCGAEALLSFWLDAESFQASSVTRTRHSQLSSLKAASRQEATGCTGLHNEPVTTSSDLDLNVKIGAGDTAVTPKSNISAHGYITSSGVTSHSRLQDGPCDASSIPDTGQTRTQNKDVLTNEHTSQNKTAGAINTQDVKSKCTNPVSCSLEHNPPYTDSISSDQVTPVISAAPVEPTNTDSGATAKPSLQEKLLTNIASDAVRIFSRYIAQEASHPIGVTDELRQDTIRKICREDGLVDPQSFVPCQLFALNQLQQKHYADFLASEFHCKHQIDILTSSTVLLSDVLYNDTALSYFTEYMELESAMPLLQCWLDLENFQLFLASRGPEADWQEAQNDAMIIYDKYFSLQAIQPLGFGDQIRFEVECNICREGGPLPDCFSKPKAIVTSALNQCYFPQYLQSELYFKYLSDLINTVQLSQDLPPTRKRRDSGSGGSEHSTQSEHTRNTLLAGARRHVTSAAVPHSVSLGALGDTAAAGADMHMDSALFNPDSLWQRPQAKDGLSLAKIDEMGRFVSDFQSQPDQDKFSLGELGIFKRSKEKDKAKEEMALQIANMIIADVNSTTNLAIQSEDTFKSEPVPD